MARQPLAAQYHRGPWSLGRGEIYKRPAILALIGKCTADWSFVEHQQALILGFLLKANTDIAIAVFSSLRTAPVKMSALKAAASEALPPNELELFTAVLEVQRKIERHRNEVVHGHWGVCDPIQDGAIWVDGKHHTQWNTEVLVSETVPGAWRSEHLQLAQHFFVYTAQDLEDVVTEIMVIWRLLFDFLSLIREAGEKREALFRRISGVNLVQQELARLRQRPQNDPAVQQ